MSGAASLAAWLPMLQPAAVTDPVVLAEKLLKRNPQQLQEGRNSSRGGGSGATAGINILGAVADLAHMLQACYLG